MASETGRRVALAVLVAHGQPDHLANDDVRLLLPVHDVCEEIVKRLLAAGISETAILNALVFYKED